MKMINLTGRPITIVNKDGDPWVTIYPAVNQKSCFASILPSVEREVEVDPGIKVPVTFYGYQIAQELPPEQPGVLYIVSFAMLNALGSSRPDTVAPDTSSSSIIRREGRVVGVRGFTTLISGEKD